jgi:hypothetical protein
METVVVLIHLIIVMLSSAGLAAIICHFGRDPHLERKPKGKTQSPQPLHERFPDIVYWEPGDELFYKYGNVYAGHYLGITNDYEVVFHYCDQHHKNSFFELSQHRFRNKDAENRKRLRRLEEQDKAAKEALVNSSYMLFLEAQRQLQQGTEETNATH